MQPESEMQDFDLFYYALNYRVASDTNAEAEGKALRRCVDRIVDKECTDRQEARISYDLL